MVLTKPTCYLPHFRAIKCWTVRRIIITILLFCPLILSAQIPTASWVSENIDSLRQELLYNKEIEKDFEHSILAALTFYPDLDSVCIRFRYKPIFSTMAARPSVWSTFKRRENRCYNIVINNRLNRRGAPLALDAYFEARVGVLAHELGHIVDYEKKSMLRIGANGVAYILCPRFKRTLEHSIDSIALSRGAGEALISFRKFANEYPDATERYHRNKNRYYLTSRQIRKMIKKLREIEQKDEQKR